MARSGDLILDSLYNNAITQDLIPSRMPQTRIGLLFSIIAADWEGWEQVLDNFKQEGYLSTAQLGDSIVKLAEPLYTRSIDKPSDAILKIEWQKNAKKDEDQVIPFGTIIQTQDAPPIQYSTTERVILYKTANAVYVRVRSLETGAHTKVAATALNVFSSRIQGVEAYNPEPSWGGKDAEPLESVRANAMSARYSMVSGTRDHVELSLLNLGLLRNEFSLYEHAYGYGTFAVFVDTVVEEQMREVTDLIANIKAEGIFAECNQATHKDAYVTVKVNIIRETQLTPEEYSIMKNDINNAIVQYVLDNGVGQKVYISKLKHYLLKQFEDRGMYDSEIDILTSCLKDYNGNIDLMLYEVLEIKEIDLEILVGE